MGVWDWIRGALGMQQAPEPASGEAGESGKPTPGPSPKTDAADVQPRQRPPKGSKKAKKQRAARDPDAPRKPKKPNRRKRKQPPGWSKEDRTAGPDPRVPRRAPEPERSVSLLPSETEPEPEPPPEPAREPVEPAEPPPPREEAAPRPVEAKADAAASPEEPRAARPSPRQRDQETLAWIVVPKLDALITDLDGVIADTGAERDALTSARSRFVREWRALRPIPAAEAERLQTAYDDRLAQITKRIDATVDPRVEEEATNVAMRETMIEAAAGLVEQPDLKTAIKQAKALQREWRDAPRVARDTAKDQNTRFRAAMDAVFARRDEEEAERLVKLEAFVDSAEALARSDDPERAAEAMKRLQSQWKSTGGVRGEKGDDVWTRFRAAADRVFERRQEKRIEMHAQSVQARQALVDEASNLADEGVEDADGVIRDLQRRWRQTGHVPREEGDALWSAFREACDRIRNPPAMDPSALGDGQEGLSFNPFSGIDRGEGS